MYVPRAVQQELNRKGRFRYRLNKLYRTGFFTRCMTADAFNVQLLQAELDKGESEALVQAQEQQALYFIGDERRARELQQGWARTRLGRYGCLHASTWKDVHRTCTVLSGYCGGTWIFALRTTLSNRQSIWPRHPFE